MRYALHFTFSSFHWNFLRVCQATKNMLCLSIADRLGSKNVFYYYLNIFLFIKFSFSTFLCFKLFFFSSSINLLWKSKMYNKKKIFINLVLFIVVNNKLQILAVGKRHTQNIKNYLVFFLFFRQMIGVAEWSEEHIFKLWNYLWLLKFFNMFDFYYWYFSKCHA